MVGEDSIREIIAFPKNQDAKDIMLDSPGEVSKNQLKSVGIKIVDDKILHKNLRSNVKLKKKKKN